MSAPTGNVAADLLTPLLSGDLRRPRLTCYDRQFSRTELSTRSLTNWTAKVCGLLIDEIGAGPGDLVCVRTPAGWQTAPILLGAWWAGLGVTSDDDPEAVAAFVPPGTDASADEVFVASGHPLGAPSTTLGAHQRDFTTATLPQSDRLPSAAAVGVSGLGVTGSGGAVTVGELLAAARAVGAELGGGVLLSAQDWRLPDGVAGTLLAALAADACLVQCPTPAGPSTPPDPDGPSGAAAARLARIATDEKATATAGVDIPGLPRLAP